jgi:hypothetical protein
MLETLQACLQLHTKLIHDSTTIKVTQTRATSRELFTYTNFLISTYVSEVVKAKRCEMCVDGVDQLAVLV